jgi:hypothetical protein
MHTTFLLENLERRRQLGELGVIERIILIWILKKSACDVNWIQPIEGKVESEAVVNTVMNLGIPYKAENFLNSGATVAF